jgi:hypothetical protein
MTDVTGPFDFVNSVLQGNTAIQFTSDNQKHYSQYLTNRALAMYVDTLPFAAEANRFRNVDDQLHYDLLFYGIRKFRRPRGKWPKAATNSRIDELCTYYGVSRKVAAEYLRTHTDEQLNTIHLALSEGGQKKPK